jgi:glutaminyl-peptide cyclotransferase
MNRILIALTLAALPCSAGAENPLDAQRAFGYLEKVCEFGPRVSGSREMTQQRQWLVEQLEELGAKVQVQKFKTTHPESGKPVRLANVIAMFRPEAERRVVLACHYDTRPFADRDPNPMNRRLPRFLGANDGASGVALLLELAHHLDAVPKNLGIDLVFFDAEELVYQDPRDLYFLGSEWWAKKYAERNTGPKYECGVVVDMIGDRDLQVYQERTSYSWQETRPIINEIWGTAARIGVKEFIPRVRYEVRDDHLAMRNIAKIPTAEIIDFDYPAWHTLADTPRQCSGESLAKVGYVLLEWLKTKADESELK